MERKTIWVKRETYEMLKALKIHPRETFDEVIRRLLDCYSKHFEQAGRAPNEESEDRRTGH